MNLLDMMTEDLPTISAWAVAEKEAVDFLQRSPKMRPDIYYHAIANLIEATLKLKNLSSD